LGLNAPNSILAGAPPHTSLGELTAFPIPFSWISSKVREGREDEAEGEGKGKERKGRGQGVYNLRKTTQDGWLRAY